MINACCLPDRNGDRQKFISEKRTFDFNSFIILLLEYQGKRKILVFDSVVP